MNQIEMSKIVGQFIRDELSINGPMKVVRVADAKTVHVETIGEIGRSIVFNEYTVDGRSYWAGYSSRSDTVFVSEASRR